MPNRRRKRKQNFLASYISMIVIAFIYYIIVALPNISNVSLVLTAMSVFVAVCAVSATILDGYSQLNDKRTARKIKCVQSAYNGEDIEKLINIELEELAGYSIDNLIISESNDGSKKKSIYIMYH